MVDMILCNLEGIMMSEDTQQIKPEIMELMERLIDKGVMFVIAGNQQHDKMKALFGEIADKISYICENGAITLYKDQIVAKFPIERKLGNQIMADMWDRGRCEIMLTGMQHTYLFPKTKEYVEYVHRDIDPQAQIIRNVADIQEDFLRISVYNKKGIDEWSDYITEKWSTYVKPVVGGETWMNLYARGVSKGNALAILQDLFDVPEDKTMCFGNDYSDLSLFKYAYFGYAMSQSETEVRAQARYITPTVESILQDVLRML